MTKCLMLASIILRCNLYAQEGALPAFRGAEVMVTQSYLKVSNHEGEIIFACDSSEDFTKVSNCKVTDGHTLDEVMTSIVRALNASQKAEGAARKARDEQSRKHLQDDIRMLDDLKKRLAPSIPVKPPMNKS